MKIKRQKKVTRVLNFFKHNFGHRPPYQLLLDGTFCNACLEMKVNIKDQLPKYLGEVKLLTTQCCLLEMEKLLKMDPKLYGALVILRQFGLHKCGHEKDPKPAMKCLKAMLGEKNESRYFVASQDSALREKARRVPGTPVLYLHRSAPTLERPSGMSEDTASQSASDRMGVSFQSKSLEALKKKVLGEPEAPKKRKRKAHEPNPMSCLKSKKKKLANTTPKDEDTKPETSSPAKAKRKRVRKRKPKGQANSKTEES